MNKLAICGAARSGKDTMAGYATLFYDMQPFAFADDMKQSYYSVFGLSENKDREGLIWYGEMCCQRDPNVWIRKVERKIDEYIRRNPQGRVIITDARKPPEFEWLRANGYVIIRVNADEEIRRQRMIEKGDKFSEVDLNHPTETYLQGIAVDYEISNNGSINDATAQFDVIAREIGLEADLR